MPKNKDIPDAAINEAEDLKDEALKDRIKDADRDRRIEKLEAGADLMNAVNQDPSQRTDRRSWGPLNDERKILPAKTEPGWYAKTEQAQKRELQKKIGSYRPEPDDPISQKPPGKAVKEGRLWDPHRNRKVRKRDVEAANFLKAAAKPEALPVAPADPGPAEAPIPGCCWWCYEPLRKGARKGTKFCCGKCRTAWNEHNADRVAKQAIYDAWQASQYADRQFSIHCAAAEALYVSALRLGLDVTFTAGATGVLAIHAAPLPPLSRAVVSLEGVAEGKLHAFQFGLQRIHGFDLRTVEVAATAVPRGTMFTLPVDKPEGAATTCHLNFEGDPGPEWRSRPPEPVPSLMNGSYAARNGRAAEYVKNAKTDNLCNNTSDS